MALEGIDPNIPLQAGRNLPQFGADWNAVQQMQRTAISVQQQQQVAQAQNALKALYSNSANYDAKTMQPTPEAMAALMRVSPDTGMKLTNNLVTLQEHRAQTAFTQGKIAEEYRTQGQDIAARSLAAYEEKLKTMPPEAAMREVQTEIYTPGVDQMKRAMPPEMQSMVSPTFSPIRARSTLANAKTYDAQQKFEVRTDHGKTPPVEYRLYGDGRTTDVAGNPYSPTGVGEAKGAEATLMEGKTPEGKTVRYRYGPSGTAIDENNKPLDATKLSDVHKVGTKAEENLSETGTPTGPADLHGQDYLDKLPAARSALIKGYAEGRVAFPGSFSLRSPYWQKMVADITQYDPGFDAVNYNSRSATRKDFTSGKSAQNITSFNTAIGHLGTLEKAAEALGNTSFPLINSVKNVVQSNIGDPRVVRFNTAKQAVSDELTRAFRGTGGNVYDIKGWEENLGAANSPEQLRGAVKQAVDLLRSRIESVGQQYRRGMGTTADVMDLLTPSAKKTLASLPGGEDLTGDKETAVKPGSPAASAAIPPSQGAVAGVLPPEVAGRLKEGVETTFANGQVWTIHNGNAMRVR